MIYMKHREHGNLHCEDADQAQREAAGWVRWPRSRDQKLNRLADLAKVADRPIPAPALQVSDESADSRDALLRDAEEKGLKVDRRWSDARLAAELAKA